MDALERKLQPTRRVLGDVDPAQPLDTTHPLTDGVEGFWLPLPRHVAGSRLYDLSGHNNHGVLKNFDLQSAWTIDQTLSYPIVKFDGVDDYITYPDLNTTVPGSPWSVSLLVRTEELQFESDEIFIWHPRAEADYSISLDDSDKSFIFNSFNGSSNILNSGVSANLGTFYSVAVTYDGKSTYKLYIDGKETTGTLPDPSLTSNVNNIGAQSFLDQRYWNGVITRVGIWSRELSAAEEKSFRLQARRGFPAFLNRRDSVGLLGGGGGTSPISGTFALTDSQETVSATGQTEVSGTLSVTDGSETLTLSGATIVSGAASITDAGEIISAVSSLQDITGTAQITDAGEEVDATGEVKIAGTATLNDGTEEFIIVGENDITGSFSFADLAAEIAATGSVELQGSLALTDAGEGITARERVPARLASVDVRLEDIIVVHATLEDTLTVDAKLTD